MSISSRSVGSKCCKSLSSKLKLSDIWVVEVCTSSYVNEVIITLILTTTTRFFLTQKSSVTE
uniref:Uncharacterized protein n=1 Tax=Helianthus annuus TaxID=4232 RepID=A0A1Y3BZS3_HELAN